MAINRYSTSSRFTDITSDDEEGKKKETNKEINERRQREYDAQVAERQALLRKEDDLFDKRNRSIEAYDRSVKEGSINPSGKLDSSRFSGGAVKTSPETLTTFNERELAAGRPVATSLLRPGSFATDEEFLTALEPTEYKPGSIHYAKYERPSEYIRKEFPKIEIPDLETERLELEVIKPGMLKGGNRKLVGGDRGEYKDPKGPAGVKRVKSTKEKFPNKKARRKANFEALFKKNGLGASKPERVKGGLENLGEKRKYKKEEKLAKATYGRGLEQMTGTELDERKASLKEGKREQMSPFKRDSETNKITGLNKPQLFKNLAVNQGARKEIRDINRAQKYSELVGGSEVDRNVYSVSDRVSRNMIDKEKNPGPKYFKPETMKNFRSSDDNPLNRNSSSRFFK